MTRLRALAAWTFGVTVVQVALGGFVRGSGSGFGCEDRWPLCENGLLGGWLPRPEFHMVVEWTHRWLASIALLLVAATAVYAWLRHRRVRPVTIAATGALLTIVAQAIIGAVVVMTELEADTVTLHLAVAMLLLGLLAFVTVEAGDAADHRGEVGGPTPARTGPTQRSWWRRPAAAATAVYVVIVLGSLVHDQYVGGYPLVGGELVPDLSDRTVALHLGHRLAVALTAVLLVWVAARAVRRARPRTEVLLVHAGAGLFLLNVGLGAAHVFTRVQSTGLVVGHLLVASLTWSALVAAAALAWRAERGRPPQAPTPVAVTVDRELDPA